MIKTTCIGCGVDTESEELKIITLKEGMGICSVCLPRITDLFNSLCRYIRNIKQCLELILLLQREKSNE